MDSDREEYYQAKMTLAIKLSKDTFYADAITWNVDGYNESKDIRHIQAINALMQVVTGSSHWSCYDCGINQHGFWNKEEEE